MKYQRQWESLNETAVKCPSAEDEWKEIADDFWRIWNFSLCLGAIDGKHCNIECPNKAGSQYFNYKKEHSIVLMAIADASYMFTYVDMGDYGRQNDAGVFRESLFGKLLLETDTRHPSTNPLSLPSRTCLPGTTTTAQYCFVSDEAFPLKEILLRPYPGELLDEIRRIFNYRLSRARIFTLSN